MSSYPWLDDPRSLWKNIKLAIARMKSLEVRLKKLGTKYTQKCQNEIDNMKKGTLPEKSVGKKLNPMMVLPITYSIMKYLNQVHH